MRLARGRTQIDPHRRDTPSRAWAALMAAALALTQILGCVRLSPTTALAAGSASMRVDSAASVETFPDIDAPFRNFHYFRVSGGGTVDGTGWCAAKTLSTPAAGTTFSGGYAYGDARVDYVLYHGYSDAGQTTGYGLTPGKLYVATQYALWLVLPDVGGSHAEVEDELTRTYAAVRQAVRRLVAEADAYAAAGGGGPEAGCATYWPSPDGALQSMLTRSNPRGGMELSKSSSNPAVSEGNACYSLEGATYGVYSDAGCTDLVATMTTDPDGNASAGDLAAGTYWVRETGPAQGYALDGAAYEVEVVGGETTGLSVTDAPQGNPVGLLVAKVDSHADAATPQGDATLAGAEFTVRYYDGTFDSIDALPRDAARTWLVSTDPDGRAWLDDAHLVSGDDLFRTSDGSPVLPLGTVTVQETKAPTGYRIADGSAHLQQIAAEGQHESVDVFVAPTFEEQVVRGGVRVQKVDYDTGKPLPQGDASLAGTEFSLVNKSKEAVVVDGASRQPDEVVATIVADASGVAQTAADALPYGTYEVRESKAPEGYLPNPDWSVTFSVQQDGATVDLTTAPLPDPVVRGGVSITKLDRDLASAEAQGDATLAEAVMSITNRSESAVLVGGVLYQPGDVVAELVTGGDGVTSSTADLLPYGTYEMREKSAPEGYLLNDEWSLTFEVREDGSVVSLDGQGFDDPVARGGVSVRKADSDRHASDPQGDATLAGAEITLYNRGAHAVVVDGVTHGPGEAVKVIRTDEGGAASTGADSLPYGTYEVRETKAPEGYLINEEWFQTFSVRADGQVVDLTGPEHAVADDVIRGGVALRKVNRELGQSLSLGSSTLAGAHVELTNASSHAVIVDDRAYEPGEVVRVLVTDESGKAATGADALPYGTYTARETVAPVGYLLNDGWSQTFSIREDGETVDLTDSEAVVADQAVRGDLSWTKAEEGTQSRMAGIPFRITSQTTGEWHVVVSDENGMVDTSSEWNSHESSTNANDAAVLADGTVDDSKLDSRAGVWFSGRTDAQTAPDDSLGALPFDTYLVEELRCAANEGRRLVSTLVTVTRSDANLDLGTMDDETIPEPVIDTDLTCGGLKVTAASDGLALTDSIHWEQVLYGSEYRLVDELHEVDANLNDLGVVATAEASFVAETSAGSTEIAFEGVDATPMTGHRLVACARLYLGDELVASHDDLADEGQTVYVPSIDTTLLSDATSGHDVPSYGSSTATDTVTLAGVPVGETVTVEGTLRDASDGTTLATASETTTATSDTVTVRLAYGVDGRALAGRTANASATASVGGVVVAAHDDLADEDQSLHAPAVSTQATSKSTGTQSAPGSGEQVVVDTVSLANLLVGKTYALVSSVHAKDVAEDGTASDGGVLHATDGGDASTRTEFVATSSDMELQVEMPYDASELAGRDLVAFEELYNEDGVLVAAHADVDDAHQTLSVPALATEARSDATGTQTLPAADEQTVTDLVHVENLVVGETYELVATVHAKGTDESGRATDLGPLTNADGNPIAAATTFSADAETADVEVSLTVGAGDLAGKDVVVFEELRHGEVVLARHADINDEDQTLHVPALRTEARDGSDGDKHVTARKGAVVVDTVSYSNVVPGETYALVSELRRRDERGPNGPVDAGPLTDAHGNPVTATTTFVPESADGTAEATFEFDATGLGDTTAVAYESLYAGEALVATHADIADEAQTVTLRPAEGTPDTGQAASPAAVVLAGGAALVLFSTLSRRRRERN